MHKALEYINFFILKKYFKLISIHFKNKDKQQKH
jgi:hypothetical protein